MVVLEYHIAFSSSDRRDFSYDGCIVKVLGDRTANGLTTGLLHTGRVTHCFHAKPVDLRWTERLSICFLAQSPDPGRVQGETGLRE